MLLVVGFMILQFAKAVSESVSASAGSIGFLPYISSTGTEFCWMHC